jgi:outer membrane protein assembly factor BamE (lipoprotein component of BamABCDE complex)
MKIRTVVILVVIGGVAYWIYKDQPTVSGFVDGLTRPIMGSNAAVKESEHKRVVSDVVPAAPEGDPASVQTIKKGMKSEEVREILGKPDRVEPFEENGVSRIRWIYVATRRLVDFEDGRVVSIAIQ